MSAVGAGCPGRAGPSGHHPQYAHVVYLTASKLLGLEGKLEVEAPAKRQRRHGTRGHHEADPLKRNVGKACCQGSNCSGGARRDFKAGDASAKKARTGSRWGQQGQATRLGRALLFRAEGRETRVGLCLPRSQGSGFCLIDKEHGQ